ncbi:MAG: hypothetical protein U0836_26965 [Pirellulales bacterium]
MGRIKYSSQEHLDANTYVDAKRLSALLGCSGPEQLLARFPQLSGKAVQTSSGACWNLGEIKAMLPGHFRALSDDTFSTSMVGDDAAEDEPDERGDKPADLIDQAEVERLAGTALDGMRAGLVRFARSTPNGLRWARADVQWLRDVTI